MSGSPLLLAVRHGVTRWNLEQRWQGRTDIELSEAGIAQAHEAASHLHHVGLRFDRVVASELRRAVETASILAARVAPGVAVERDGRWSERDVGPWSGCTTAEIAARWPGELEAWMNSGDAGMADVERRVDIERRASEALRHWIDVARTTDSVILLVAHGGVLRALDGAFGLTTSLVANLSGRWFGADPEGRPVPLEPVQLLDRPRQAGGSL